MMRRAGTSLDSAVRIPLARAGSGKARAAGAARVRWTFLPGEDGQRIACDLASPVRAQTTPGANGCPIANNRSEGAKEDTP
jgi:hypothetical protein